MPRTVSISPVAPDFAKPTTVSVTALIGLWIARSRQRRQLKAMDAHRLHDLGISHHQAMTEAAKPFWKA